MSKEEGTPKPKKEEDKTSKNETQESETPTKDSESDELKSYKARMEHHQKKQKELEEKNKQLKKKLSSKDSNDKEKGSSSNEDDISRIMDVTQATKGLDKDDIEQLRKVADANNTSLSEARESELFRGYLNIKEEKVAKDKETPEPDSRKAPENKDFSDYTQEDLEKLSDDELLKYVQWEKKNKS